MEKCAAREAVHAIATSRRVVNGWTAVATDRVGAGIAHIRIVDPKLRVVEDIEGFGAKLDQTVFGDSEVLEECHVEVQATWVIQGVSAGIAEGQALGRRKCSGIQQKGTETSSIISTCRDRAVSVADDIGVR